MPLEFNKILPEVQRMGRYLAFRDSEELVDKALQILKEKGSDLDFVRERIREVRDSDVSGYRGAAPLDAPYVEALEVPHEEHPAPDIATIVAADGSQIYPDFHASSLYYLLNISTFIYYHGIGELPEQDTEPRLYYTDNYMYDETRRIISNRTVNSRRTVAEIRALWEKTWVLRGIEGPVIALHDGNLLKFFGGDDVADSGSLIKEYMGLLVGLQDNAASLAGYVDTPRSTYLIGLLHLLDLEDDQIDDANLRQNGDLEGLIDVQVMEKFLQPGERSALMVQNSPTNFEFKQHNSSHEIASCYINVSSGHTPHIARLDMPMWVARDADAVHELHALVLSQCRIQGRMPYPYALTRADELAYVSSADKNHLEELVRRELMSNNMSFERASAKIDSKELARNAFRTEHRLGQ